MQGRKDGRAAAEGGIPDRQRSPILRVLVSGVAISRVPDLRAAALCGSTSPHADSMWLKPALRQRVPVLQGMRQKCPWRFALWPSLCRGGE